MLQSREAGQLGSSYSSSKAKARESGALLSEVTGEDVPVPEETATPSSLAIAFHLASQCRPAHI